MSGPHTLGEWQALEDPAAPTTPAPATCQVHYRPWRPGSRRRLGLVPPRARCVGPKTSQTHHGSWSCSCPATLAPGDAGKHCECEVDPTSDFVSHVSPAVRKHSASPKVTSCDVFESAKQGEPWDREQWKAVAGLCSGPALNLPEAGADAMSVQSLASMVDAWISEGFSNNYARLYRDGWLEEAFVNFIGSSPSRTKWALINEQLIRSVHLFSTRPIVVIHFGMVTPREWDPKKYPRLVVRVLAARHSRISLRTVARERKCSCNWPQGNACSSISDCCVSSVRLEQVPFSANRTCKDWYPTGL